MKIGNLEIYGVIYKITNNINQKVYIGQTVDGFDRRYKNNLVKYTHNSHLRSAVKKYGLDNFSISKVLDIAFSKEELNIKEALYIERYFSTNEEYGYNKTSGGSDVVFTDEIKSKMSKTHKKNWQDENFRAKTIKSIQEATSKESYKINMSKAIKNSKKHKEYCQSQDFKITQSNLKKELWKEDCYKEKVLKGIEKSWDNERKERASQMMKDRYESEEYKRKIAESFTDRWKDKEQREKLCNSMRKTFLMIDIETNEITEFHGRLALANHIGKSESYVKKYMTKQILHKDRYKFIRKDKFEEAI